MKTCIYDDVVEKWGCFEVTVQGKKEGNPFSDYSIIGIFHSSYDELKVNGFYDGDGCYKVRFIHLFKLGIFE